MLFRIKKIKSCKIKMAIKVFSLNNCTYCEKAKEYLRSKNLVFEEIVYDKATETDSIMYLVELTNWTTFPQIFVDDTFIGGYEHLLEYEFDDGQVRFEEKF